MSLLFRFVTLAFVSSAMVPAGAAPGPADILRVVEGIPAFSLYEVPGILRLDPEKACALLFDQDRHVYGALGTSSGGRVVAFAHDVFLAAERFQTEPALGKLAANSIRWAGLAETPAVGMDPGLKALEPLLRAQGFEVRSIAPAELERQVDVYCFAGPRPVSKQGMDNLRRFLLKGGGVITVATPWALSEAFPDFHRLPANEIAMLAGIEFLPEGTAQIRGIVKFPK